VWSILSFLRTPLLTWYAVATRAFGDDGEIRTSARRLAIGGILYGGSHFDWLGFASLTEPRR
jgi:hypothetical protein